MEKSLNSFTKSKHDNFEKPTHETINILGLVLTSQLSKDGYTLLRAIVREDGH